MAHGRCWGSGTAAWIGKDLTGMKLRHPVFVTFNYFDSGSSPIVVLVKSLYLAFHL